MQTLLTNKMASLTELREPNKVLEMAGNSPVAIMNRNVAVGYFVPMGAVTAPQPVGANQIDDYFAKHHQRLKPLLHYLQDK